MFENVDYTNLIKNTIIGGLIIGLTSFLATYMSTKLAAIVWSLPLSLLPTIIFMWSIKTHNKEIGNFAFNSSLGCINLITFGFIVGYILKFSKFKDNKYSLVYGICCAMFVWTIGAVLLYFYSPYE